MERNKYAIVTPSQRPEDVNKHAAEASCLQFIFPVFIFPFNPER